ncbi:MAG: FAD:protein FMN transferase [Planctomycetes bacterium]|nr:FAD:protein FMN transferase [Planctomycetota bacterium]
MTDSEADKKTVNSLYENIADLRRFSYEAMATVFEVFIVHEDAGYAQQAAYAAFDVLDRLEAELSRYVENSDISIVNNLAVGEKYTAGIDTFNCLKQCQQLYHDTNGCFDVTIGALFDCWLDKDKRLLTPTEQQLVWAKEHTGADLYLLDGELMTVELKMSPLKIDLGGFGKGYAVDEMAKGLGDWGITKALIHSGRSSVFGMGWPDGEKGWPVIISNPLDRGQILERLYLRDYAISGSGLEKGSHIIDPRSGRPVKGKAASWSAATTAAVADGLSTAFMIMSDEEMKQYCRDNRGNLAMVMKEGGGSVVKFGDWPGDGCVVGG